MNFVLIYRLPFLKFLSCIYPEKALLTVSKADDELNFEGELEGFDINDYINNNELFEEFAANYRLNRISFLIK